MKNNSGGLILAGLASSFFILAGSASPALSKCVQKHPLFGIDVYVEDKYCQKKMIKKKPAAKRSSNPTQTRSVVAAPAAKSDPRIKKMQTMLTSMGYNTGPADGLNGPATQKAAGEFNLANDLPKKASIGSTNAVLMALLAPKPERRVMEMQDGLSKTGYYSGPADGFNSPTTRAAAGKFNLANDLPKKASIGSTNAVLKALLTPKPDPRVLEMQERLSKMGYYSGPVDGLKGPETKKAAAQFNVANGLPKKAAVGSTLAVLNALQGNTNTSTTRQRRKSPEQTAEGDNDIRQMQTLLAGLGYNPGPANGFEGPETTKALGKFHASLGLTGSTPKSDTLVLLNRAAGK